MNKKCGKCSKTVYPTEELKCLDKVWHKACFKCQVCNMTLNMKNYKGYDKFPYCNAHYPTTKHTAVADTPESRRIAQNTKIQSNIKYHEQFEKEKGTKISVADDPETERLKKNMQVVSNVAYHNTLQQKFAQDANRPLEATDITAARNRRNPGSISDYNPPVEASPAASRSQPTHVYNSKGEDDEELFADNYNQPARRQIGSIADYDPVSMQGYQPPPQQQQQPRNPALFSPTPYSPPGQFSSKQRQIGSVPGPMSNAGQAQGYQYGQPQVRPGAPSGALYVPFRPQVGNDQLDAKADVNDNNETDDKLAESIQILDDLERSLSDNNLDEQTDSPETMPRLHDPSESVTGGKFMTTYPIPDRQEPPEDSKPAGQFMTTYPIAGYADTQGSRSSYTSGYSTSSQDAQGSRSSYNDYPVPTQEEPQVDDGFQAAYPTHPSPPSPPPAEAEPEVGNGFRTTYPTDEPAPQPAKASRGIVSKAMYDYQAADTDEVSFQENDIIINCEPVDDGWMYGTVERSGQRGMLPSNYVQRIN